MFRSPLSIDLPTCVKEGVFLISSCPTLEYPNSEKSHRATPDREMSKRKIVSRKRPDVEMTNMDIINRQRSDRGIPNMQPTNTDSMSKNSRDEKNWPSLDELMPSSADLATLAPDDRTCWQSAIDVHLTVQKHLASVSEDDVFYKSTVDDLKVPLMLVLKAFANVYVSDRLTGLVYANLDVFACHASPRSVPCLWRVYVPGEPITPLRPIREFLEWEFYYAPPTAVPEKLTPRCQPGARDDCREDSEFFTEDLAIKCRSFTNLVQQKWFPFSIFKNRYCYECVAGSESIDDLVLVDKGREVLPMSGVLMTVQRNKVSLVTEKTLENQDWKTAECKLLPDIPCEIFQCKTNVTKRPDGECKDHYTLHMALNLNLRSSSTQKRRRLAKLLQCMAGKYLHFDWDSEFPPKLTVYDLDKDIELFGVEIGFYRSYYDINWDDLRVFSWNYGNSLLQIITGDEMSPNMTTDSTHHDINLFRKDIHGDKVTYISATNISANTREILSNGLLSFCIGFKEELNNLEATLACYPRIRNGNTQHNDSCVVEYFSVSSSSASSCGMNILSISFSVISFVSKILILSNVKSIYWYIARKCGLVYQVNSFIQKLLPQIRNNDCIVLLTPP